MNTDQEPATDPGDEWRSRLRQALDDRGLKYGPLSEDAGYNGEYVSKMLSGRINPTVDRILKICKVAGIEPGFIFGTGSNSDENREVVEAVSNLSEREASLVNRLLQSARSE